MVRGPVEFGFLNHAIILTETGSAPFRFVPLMLTSHLQAPTKPYSFLCHLSFWCSTEPHFHLQLLSFRGDVLSHTLTAHSHHQGGWRCSIPGILSCSGPCIPGEKPSREHCEHPHVKWLDMHWSCGKEQAWVKKEGPHPHSRQIV